MTSPLSIAVADAEPEALEALHKAVLGVGHRVCVAARTGSDLVEHCRGQRPDLIIADVSIPHRDVVAAARLPSPENPVPVILTSSDHDGKVNERVEAPCILACLTKPITQAQLMPAIALTISHAKQLQALRQEGAALQQTLSRMSRPPQ